MTEGKLNKSGNRRGLHKRTDETRKKQGARTIERAHGQYVRSCDSKVGKYLRYNETPKYNETLDKADKEQK
jgi:hypothetical protein